MDYKKIMRIATELEKQVEEESFVDQLDERTEDEKDVVDAPEPSLEAGEFDEDVNIEGCDDKRIASLKKLIHLARRVKNSSMTASEKRIAMQKISQARSAAMNDEDNLDDKSVVINKQLLSQQNTGNNRKKVMEIFQNINKLRAIKPTTRLSQLNVNLPIPVNQITVRQLLNIVNDIANQN